MEYYFGNLITIKFLKNKVQIYKLYIYFLDIFIIFVSEIKAKIIKNTYYAHGKLLLSSEYLVLDGAKAIALPCKKGQRMTIKKSRGSDLVWESIDHNGEVWFHAQISLYDFSAIKTNDEEIAKNLRKILKNAVRLNSEFLSKWNGFKVETQLEFPLEWGLGSSSTLINLVAQWADINPFLLHFKVSQGSGYDVACAESDGPIMYELTDEAINFSEIELNSTITNKLYFIYQGNKQDSRSEVVRYNRKVKNKSKLAGKLTDITDRMMVAGSLKAFEELVSEHEQIVAKALDYTPIKEQYFSDYWGSIKSLGAWGGDFILATSSKDAKETIQYFKSKGLETVFPYADMILP